MYTEVSVLRAETVYEYGASKPLVSLITMSRRCRYRTYKKRMKGCMWMPSERERGVVAFILPRGPVLKEKEKTKQREKNQAKGKRRGES